MKKIVVFLLTIAFLVSNITIGYASVSTSTQEHAIALNAIGIIKGNGVNFNLEGKLKRSEGATFIVRLLGKEEEVLQNKDSYIYTTLKDVNINQWYAPYVGYCVKQGIIGGYSDQTFRPDDVLSEQSFVKMVLVAMGYKVNVDFTWSTTFSFAYQIGLLTDIKYSNLKTDNLNYSRGNVVDLLYRSMGMNDATGTIKIIQRLIDAGVLTSAQAKQYGFIRDSVIMKVDKLERTSGKYFTIQFNEEPAQFTAAQILIQEKGTSNLLEASSIMQGENPYIFYFQVLNQIPDIDYIMTINLVKDTEGNLMSEYVMDFVGYRPNDYMTSYNRVAKVEEITNSYFDVYFTHPIDAAYIQPSDFLIKKSGKPVLQGTDSNLELMTDSSNPFVIHIGLLNYSFEKDTSYELVVSGTVKSMFGAYLKEGQGDSAKFITKDLEYKGLVLEKVELESSTSLILYFNKSLNVSVAEQVFSYYVTTIQKAPIKISKSEVITSGVNASRAVRLTTDTSLELNKDYNLVINQLYTSDRSESIFDFSTVFKTQPTDLKTMNVLSANATSTNRVTLTVDQYLDEAYAGKTSLYSIKGVNDTSFYMQPTSVYYDKYAQKPTIVLTFNQNLKNMNSYTVTIESDMKIADGTTLKSDASYVLNVNQTNFTSDGLVKANYIGNNTVLISAGKELSLNVPNVLNNNYTLSYMIGDTNKSIQPIGVTYINANIILLRFETIDTTLSYQLVATSLMTLTGTKMDTSKQTIPLNIEILR